MTKGDTFTYSTISCASAFPPRNGFGLHFEPFKIVDGTGRFDSLEGHGRMIGQLTCLPQSLMRNGKASCAELGGYSEVPFQLSGRYIDPRPGAWPRRVRAGAATAPARPAMLTAP